MVWIACGERDSAMYRPGGRSSLAVAAPCMHPACKKRVHRGSGSTGRPRSFCSSACRLRFVRDRQKLLEARREVVAEMQDATYRSRRLLAVELTTIDWHLERFGGVRAEDSEATGISGAS
jgi:hypothetical protein